MLILRRKAKQGIVIGENIELVVVAVDSNRVKLGVKAPSDVSIHRQEVHRRIQSVSSVDFTAETVPTETVPTDTETVVASLEDTDTETAVASLETSKASLT